MRTISSITIFLVVFFQSCTKHQDCDDSEFFYQMVQGKPKDHLVTDLELNTIESLFNSNNLNIDNLLFYKLQTDKSGMYHAKCYQYVNNLKLFSNDLIFHFDSEGNYTTLSGDPISEIYIGKEPSMKICEVIIIFLDNIKSIPFNNTLISDGFLCELGYYDINGGTGNAVKNFQLAWRINPSNKVFPYAIINDYEKKLIYFDDGIRY